VRRVMGATDFLRLPPGAMILVVVMLWPAIWAGTLLLVALAGDLIRLTRKAKSPARARDVLIRG
jgi:hypothetical protein